MEGLSKLWEVRAAEVGQDGILSHEKRPELFNVYLVYSEGYLWLVGSHSSKRSKPDKKSLEKNLERLAKVSSDGNRYLLGTEQLSGSIQG